jgi:hypothetical protein
MNENRRLLKELQEAYEQLSMVRKIMGVEADGDGLAGGDDTESGRKGPFIAGSMLPDYYTENTRASGKPAISDLERISQLRDKGFLSQEEFVLCKSKLLQELK